MLCARLAWWVHIHLLWGPVPVPIARVVSTKTNEEKPVALHAPLANMKAEPVLLRLLETCATGLFGGENGEGRGGGKREGSGRGGK